MAAAGCRGRAVAKKQADISINGWAFEARLYAEDPVRGFLPATGRLTHLSFPGDTARVDAGVRLGDTITPYYDPLIAKLIVHGQNRSAALGKLQDALKECRIGGTVTNLDFLIRLTEEHEFRSGHPDTGLIDRETERLTAPVVPGDEALALAAIISTGALEPETSTDPWSSLGSWQIWGDAHRTVAIDHADVRATVTLASRGRDQFAVRAGGSTLPVLVLDRIEGGARVEVAGKQRLIGFARDRESMTLFHHGRNLVFHLPDGLAGEQSSEVAEDELLAPMPGLVKLVRVEAGDTVSKGQPLIVLEAMKMELTLSASREGTIANVHVTEGAQVSEGMVLVTLMEEAAQ